MWFIASVAWAAESFQLQGDLEDKAKCESFVDTIGRTTDTDDQTFVQVNISIVSILCICCHFVLNTFLRSSAFSTVLYGVAMCGGY